MGQCCQNYYINVHDIMLTSRHKNRNLCVLGVSVGEGQT